MPVHVLKEVVIKKNSMHSIKKEQTSLLMDFNKTMMLHFRFSIKDIRNGFLLRPDTPGLGITWNESIEKKYPFDE